MKIKIEIGKKSYDVDISRINDRLFKITVEDEEFIFAEDKFGELTLIDKKDYPSFQKLKEEVICDVFEEKEIKSPITGVVSNIYVKEGEKIKPGQPVVTLIAMKMENEIISETCGKIKEIKVKENQQVSKDDVLIILE